MNTSLKTTLSFKTNNKLTVQLKAMDLLKTAALLLTFVIILVRNIQIRKNMGALK